MKKYTTADHLRFIIPSLLGVLLFMTPIKTDDGFSIVIALLASKVQDLLKDELSLIMMIIIILTAIITILAKLIGSNRLKESSFFLQIILCEPILDAHPYISCCFCNHGLFQIRFRGNLW